MNKAHQSYWSQEIVRADFATRAIEDEAVGAIPALNDI